MSEGTTMSSIATYESARECEQTAAMLRQELRDRYQHHAAFCARIELDTTI